MPLYQSSQCGFDSRQSLATLNPTWMILMLDDNCNQDLVFRGFDRYRIWMKGVTMKWTWIGSFVNASMVVEGEIADATKG